MTLFIGFAGYFSIPLFQHPERAERVASLLLDPRWPWRPISAAFGLRESWHKRTRRRRLSGRNGRDVLRDGILDPEHREALLNVHLDVELDHAKVALETGQRPIDPDWQCRFAIKGHTKADDLPVGADLLAWLEVMHELMAALDAGHAVLSVVPSMNAVYAETSFAQIILDTAKGDHLRGVSADIDRQLARANYWRPELGGKYIRHPRWGTYLRRSHLDRVGGLAKVRDSVPLARIVELGELVFLQCTAHPSTARTPEGEQVRRALEDALAPIVVPPRPNEQPAA